MAGRYTEKRAIKNPPGAGLGESDSLLCLASCFGSKNHILNSGRHVDGHEFGIFMGILKNSEYLVRECLSDFFYAGEIEYDCFEFFKTENQSFGLRS